MGKKDNCPINTPEGYLDHNRDNFRSYVDSTFENNPRLKGNDIVVLNAIYNAYVSENPVLGDAFGLWVRELYPNYVSDASIRGSIENLSPAENAAKLFVNDIIDDYTDTKTVMPIPSEQDANDGEAMDEASHEHQSTVEVWADKVDAERFFRDRIFSAINKRVDDKELAVILDFARKNTGDRGFERFLDFILEKYPDLGIEAKDLSPEDILLESMFGEVALDKVKDPRKLQALKQVHISNDPMNKFDSNGKKYWVITNWDGEKVTSKGSKFLQRKPAMNFKTKTKNPDTFPASFIDVSKAKTLSGKTVGSQTEYMSLNDFVDLVERKDGTWWAKDSQEEYSIGMLNRWLKQLLRGQDLTIATMRGGNSGTLILAKVDKLYYSIMSPEKVLKQFEKDIPSKMKPYLVKHNNNFTKALINYHNDLMTRLLNEGPGRWREDVAVFNSMEIFGRKLAILQFKKYLDYELKNKNIDKAGYDILLRNIDELPVKGIKDKQTGMHQPNLFMGEFLASVIARHEHLKAIIGKDYSKDYRELSLEEIFSRMRQPASEGPTYPDGSDKIKFTIDETRVYFRNTETGERIDISQKIKGQSDNVDIDDGQMDIDSDMMDELSFALGRKAVMKYEHDPMEIKISQYLLEQNDDKDKPDDYFISKQMAFLAEPGMEIVDSETNKVLVSYRLDPDGRISMYTGPGTDFPGTKVNQVLSLNEEKQSTGRFALEGKSYNMQRIPSTATRAVILPSTKSHIDAAIGTTWANSFNIDDPIFNRIREKLFEIYTKTMDKHLDLLHRARKDPEIMKKLVKYRYRIIDDATTEVQKLMTLSEYGLHHPVYRKIFRSSIFNQLVIEGALKGRISIDRTRPSIYQDGVSTTAKLKQDKLNRIKMVDGKPEGVMIGIGNDRMFNYIQDKYMQEQLKISDFDTKAFLETDIKSRLTALNKFLKDSDVMYEVQVSRQPIQHSGGVVYRKILEILPNVGNSIVAHVQDVAFAWIGDGDGDTVNISQLPSEKDTRELMDLLESAGGIIPEFTSDLSKYKHAPTTSPLSYKGFTETLLSSIQYHNSQGTVTNVKTIASIMELKLGDNPIVLTDGTEIEIIKARDMVVLDYAPLLDDFDTRDLPNFASVVDKNGKPWKEGAGEKFMRTMAAHERLEILNAATDNVKEHLMGKMWGLTSDTIISRIYRSTDGQPLKKEHIKLLKKLNKFFNYSRLRNGRNKKTGRKMTDTEFYAKTEGIYNFLKNGAKGKEDILKNVIKLQNIGIESISISDKLVVDEVLLTRPYELMAQEANSTNENSKVPSFGHISGTPLSWTEAKDRNTHFAAMEGFKTDEITIEGVNDVIDDIKRSLPEGEKLTDEVYEVAKDWVVDFAAAWKKQLDKKRNVKAKYQKEPTSQAYDYDMDMMKFMAPWEKSFAKGMLRYGEAFRLAITYKMFLGIADVKRYSRMFFPMEMLNEQLFDTYMKQWQRLFHAKDKNGVDLMSSEVSKTTTDRKITDYLDNGRCID